VEVTISHELISDCKTLYRYAINDSSADWRDAEQQVAKNLGIKGKLDVVSVKSNGVKRKADDGADGASPEKSDKKKTRRGGGKKAKY